MFDIVILGLGLCLLGYAFYKWATANNDFFAKRHLPYLTPSFLIGTTGKIWLKLYYKDDFFRMIYNQIPTAKIVGMFDFRQPMFMLRDPALIKQMLVKDFDHFEDHKLFFDPTVDKLFGNSLVLMSGDRWRDMRATLSPFFTGSKMRQMFDMVADCADDMVAVLRSRTTAGGATDGAMRADVKDLFGRYATDVIATTAFGVKVNSFADERNEFYTKGKRAMNITSLRSALKLLLIMVFPRLANWLDVQLIDADVSRFFSDLTMDTIRTRLEKKIFRPDIINLLMQVKTKSVTAAEQDGANDSAGFATVEESQIGRKHVDREWSDLELAAQAFLFFVGGFDTTSTLLSFLMYELAVNPDVQQKLFEECREWHGQMNGGRLSYDAVQKMQYMDQVVSETLRKWPPAMLTDRLCVRDYEYNDGSLQFRVEKGKVLWLPIFALHHDEKYFPEPDRFRPERFSDECKDTLVAGTFLPFGLGPRNCIGSRFALMETKAIVYHILMHFSVEPTHETPIPLKVAKAPGVTQPHKDIIVSLKLRSE